MGIYDTSEVLLFKYVRTHKENKETDDVLLDCGKEFLQIIKKLGSSKEEQKLLARTIMLICQGIEPLLLACAENVFRGEGKSFPLGEFETKVDFYLTRDFIYAQLDTECLKNVATLVELRYKKIEDKIDFTNDLIRNVLAVEACEEIYKLLKSCLLASES